MILANELHAEIVRKGLSQRIAKSKVLGWQPVRIVEPKKKRCG